MKYIDADRICAEIKIIQKSLEQRDVRFNQIKQIRTNCMIEFCKMLNNVIDSLQQDETQVDKMLCSQVWWEEQGWIMIPPDATIEGIDSLLKQVRKKLQQELTPDTNVLNVKLVNLLKKYRIGEETARTIADRIADTYGVQRYMDGLCDGSNEKDTKKERSDVDLEKEVVSICKTYGITEHLDAELGPLDIKNIAHHFYELGLNARKL